MAGRWPACLCCATEGTACEPYCPELVPPVDEAAVKLGQPQPGPAMCKYGEGGRLQIMATCVDVISISLDPWSIQLIFSLGLKPPPAPSAGLGGRGRAAAPPALDSQAVVAAVGGVQQAQHRQQPRQHAQREAAHLWPLALHRMTSAQPGPFKSIPALGSHPPLAPCPAAAEGEVRHRSSWVLIWWILVCRGTAVCSEL